MTADCRDDTDIGKQFRRQNSVGSMLLHFEVLICTFGGKIQLFKSYCYPIYECALASFIPDLY